MSRPRVELSPLPAEAPRWKLLSAHYLNVPKLPDGTAVEWEHKETARETGRTVRKLYPVPMLLDPKDPADWNYPEEIIVAWEGTPYSKDIIFLGEPTPEMEPLNTSAEEISARLHDRWSHPINDLPTVQLSQDEKSFYESMTKAFMAMSAGGPPVTATVPRGEIEALRAEIDALKAKLAEWESADA